MLHGSIIIVMYSPSQLTSVLDFCVNCMVRAHSNIMQIFAAGRPVWSSRKRRRLTDNYCGSLLWNHKDTSNNDITDDLE